VTQLNQNTSKWDETKTARLRDHYATGASHSIIARKINEEFGTTFSRNACIGKTTRLKFARPPIPFRERKAKPKRERAYAPGGFSKDWGKPLEIDNEPHSAGITINMLEKHSCRWPVGEVEPAVLLYCGHVAEEDLSYCPQHRIIGTQPRKSRENIRASY
jgi:GcrA cell cycle regulator